jgi:hypothetical protein
MGSRNLAAIRQLCNWQIVQGLVQLTTLIMDGSGCENISPSALDLTGYASSVEVFLGTSALEKEMDTIGITATRAHHIRVGNPGVMCPGNCVLVRSQPCVNVERRLRFHRIEYSVTFAK